jgi:hypothetical protein
MDNELQMNLNIFWFVLLELEQETARFSIFLFFN